MKNPQTTNHKIKNQSSGKIRFWIGFIAILFAAAGIDAAPDSQLYQPLILAAIGSCLMFWGLKSGIRD